MGRHKAAICVFLGSILLIIMTSCQNYVVPDSSKKVKEVEAYEQEGHNVLKGNTPELMSDDVLQDEIGKQDNIVLPTIAPATPVSSSFILISPSAREESVHQSISPEHEPVHHESVTQSGRSVENSQIDEVEFGPDALVQKDLEKLLPPDETKTKDVPLQKIGESTENGNASSLELKVKEREEPIIDIMQYEARDKETAVDNNSEDIKENHTATLNLESQMKENNANLQLEKDNKSIEMIEEKDTVSESDLQDKGILESFNDWKEKQGTNGKEEGTKSVVRGSVKKRGSKKTNYASSECGAKVIATNPEAENVGAVLNENRDFYMLNPCSCNIWFVIELCEKVRAETIEVANFELFSSTMEKFNVYFSTRYPTREWEHGGLFHGKAERTIQSYNMAEEYYAKFVKIEILSHFGKEHYCPLSLVHVFGRSEVEELDDSEDPSAENDVIHAETETSSRSNHKELHAGAKSDGNNSEKQNFLKSAKDMVIGLVNKATQSFTGSNDKINVTNISENGSRPLNVSNQLSENEKQNKNSGNQSVLPKVIHLSDENNDTSIASDSDSNPVEDKEISTGNSSRVLASVAPNLVILLDGDDTEEETDSSSHSKLCIFNGEIDLSRCANPKVKFWVQYLFTLRICPLSSDNLLYNRNYSIHEALAQTKYNGNTFNFTINTLNITTSKTKVQLQEVTTQHQLGIDITTFNEANSFVSGTSSHSHSSSVNDVVVNKEQQNGIDKIPLVSPSISEQKSEKLREVTAAELIKQKTNGEMAACEKRLPSQPDLSQLLSEAISKKNKASHIEKDTIESSTKIATSSSAYEPKDNLPENKGKTEHVDVLVINYDEHLGEGKAEIPVDVDKKEPFESDNKLTNVNSKVTESEILSEQTKKEIEIPTKIIEETVSDASSKVSTEESKMKSLPTDSFIETVRLTEKGGEKRQMVDDVSEDLGKISPSMNTLQNEMVQVHSSISKEGEIKLNTSFLRIEPSFSEPATDSLESHETQSVSNYETIKFSTTNSVIGTAVNPASVLQSSSIAENYVLSATVPAGETEMKNQVHISHEKVPDIGESLSTSVEQFAKQKMEAVEKLAQLESPVKIGSGSSGNNKESAILKLKSKVKELASNLSLSTLYLEEMSKRYGTALEEQQKQFKLKISLLNQTVARNREIIDKQRESIEELTKQVMMLTLRLQNLTEVTREHNLQMTERYAFTCMIEAFIIIIVLYTCIRGPRVVQQQQAEHRRHSAPSSYNNLFDHGNVPVFHSGSYNLVADQRPFDQGTLHQLDHSISTNPAYSAIAKRRRQKKKKLSEGSLYLELDQTDLRSTKETAVISNKAGVLFSAGKGIFSGLTGAFSKQKKAIASRQTRALIDSTEDERVKSLGRSKSLSTIEEDDIVFPPHRHKSFENIRSSKYKRALTRLSDSDKRRA